MKIVKLKDYKGSCVCYIDDYEEIHIVDTSDIDYIKELSENGKIFYGTEESFVIPSNFIEEELKDYIFNNGYDDMIDRINFDSKEFKELTSVFEKWIKSIEYDNRIYYQDEDIIIEVK